MENGSLRCTLVIGPQALTAENVIGPFGNLVIWSRLLRVWQHQVKPWQAERLSPLLVFCQGTIYAYRLWALPEHQH